jgi:hypothetical protein
MILCHLKPTAENDTDDYAPSSYCSLDSSAYDKLLSSRKKLFGASQNERSVSRKQTGRTAGLLSLSSRTTAPRALHFRKEVLSDIYRRVFRSEPPDALEH